MRIIVYVLALLVATVSWAIPNTCVVDASASYTDCPSGTWVSTTYGGFPAYSPTGNPVADGWCIYYYSPASAWYCGIPYVSNDFYLERDGDSPSGTYYGWDNMGGGIVVVVDGDGESDPEPEDDGLNAGEVTACFASFIAGGVVAFGAFRSRLC